MGHAFFIPIIFALSILYLRQRQRSRDAAARARGGGVVPKCRGWEPLTSFDFHGAAYVDVPFLHRHIQHLGRTFQVSSLWSRPFFVTSAPENIRAISSGKDFGIEPIRSKGMDHFCGRGFLTTDGKEWQHSRKLIRPTFAGNHLIDFDFLATEVDHLIESIPSNGDTVDLQPLLYTLFLNTSIQFLMGIDPRQETPGAPSTPQQFIDAFHAGKDMTMLFMVLGRLARLVPKSKYYKACQTSHGYLDYHIDQALNDPDRLAEMPRLSMLHVLATQTNDRAYIRHQLLQGMLASQETTSALLGNACFLLSRHPHYWSQLRKEGLSRDLKEFKFNTLVNLKPVQNILLETLRLYPIFHVQAREALNDTYLPVGAGPARDERIFIPKGTELIMSFYALHQETGVFGEDFETFRPERWENTKPGQWDWMAFGGGNRSCLGQPKVLAEAAFVLIRLARIYSRVESRDSRDFKGDVKLTCKNANGCKVAFYI